MAKKEKEAKIILERTYNVPLRREFIKSPKYRRAKKAVSALKNFLKRHMKAELKDIKIGKYANLDIWKNGIKNPPHHIKVNVKKNDKGIVFAELAGALQEKIFEVKKEIKKPELKEKEEKEEKEVKEEKEEKKEEIKKLRAPEETEEKKEKDKILTKRL